MPDKEPQSNPQKIKYHEEKVVLGSWVNRRPAARVSSPAITQHLVYWIPEDFTTKRVTWVGNIDKFLVQLKQHLRDKGIRNKAHEFLPLSTDPSRRYQAAQLAFDWQGMPVNIGIELHQEYFTLSTNIDLARTNIAALSPATPAARNLVFAMNSVSKIAGERYSILKQGKRPQLSEYQEKFSSSYKVIHSGIWNDFFREILAFPLASQTKESSIGSVLVDFRGLLINQAKEKRLFGSSFLVPVGTQPTVKDNDLPNSFSDEESIRVARTMLPFMISGIAGQEHTVSRFFDGKCIYMTAMGAQPPELGGNRDSEPYTSYLIVSTHADRNELGQLVDRLQGLSAVRIAALYDLPAINEAGEQLHELEQKDMDGINKEGAHDQGYQHGDSAGQGGQKLIRIAGRLQAISEMVPGSLSYRVERSRYYQSEFNDLVASLRMGERGRVDGFQPYDEFVKRRLGGSYTFIDMVGVRYDRM